MNRTDLPAQCSGISESDFIQNHHGARPESPQRDTAKNTVNPLAWIHLARGIHARLIDAQCAPQEKLRLAREVEGALFTAESNIRVNNRARLLFFRLRTYAHITAKRGSNALRHNATTWLDYDELELLVEKAIAEEKIP